MPNLFYLNFYRGNKVCRVQNNDYKFVNNNKQPLAINLFMAICIYLACTRFSDKCHYGVA